MEKRQEAGAEAGAELGAEEGAEEEGAEEQPAKAAAAMMSARVKASFFMCVTPYFNEICGRFGLSVPRRHRVNTWDEENIAKHPKFFRVFHAKRSLARRGMGRYNCNRRRSSAGANILLDLKRRGYQWPTASF